MKSSTLEIEEENLGIVRTHLAEKFNVICRNIINQNHETYLATSKLQKYFIRIFAVGNKSILTRIY